MKKRINVRSATAADNALLADLGARTFQESFGADNIPENIAAYLAESFSPDIQAAELNDPSVFFLIAESDGTVAGYAQMRDGEPPTCITGSRPVELVRLYARKEWIGYGVGAALMQACIAEAERRGHSTLWLGVWEHNARARSFYRRWNFHEVGTHIFQLGDDPQTDFLLQRTVGPV
jgi:GNAT superfamily N-acetyltransferase